MATIISGDTGVNKVVDGSIATVDLADDAVTTDKLANSINTERTANTAKVTNATHTGEVTGATALTIADNIVDEANLKVSNAPTNGYYLSAQSGDTGGLTWAAVSGGGSGKVLQTVKTQHSSTTQLTSSGAWHELSTSFRLAITPSSATSTLYFSFDANFCSPASNNLAYAQFYNVTAAAGVNLATSSGGRNQVHWSKRSTSFDGNDFDTLNMTTADASSSTAARTYTIYHKTEGKVDQFLSTTLAGAGFVDKPTFTIIEVEA